MTKKYRQFSEIQRYQLESFLKVGKRQCEIARLLGIHKSTVSRELKRNKTGTAYEAQLAHRQTLRRHHSKSKQLRFTDEMKIFARELLINKKYSPELISVEGKSILGDFVSTESIYQWIWHCKHSQSKNDKADKYLFEHLKHGRRRQKRANKHGSPGIIRRRVFISNRPKIINQRKRLGDAEADLIMGKNYSAGILILTDRKSRMNWLEKIETKEASHVQTKIERIIARSKQPIKSITFDNDKAFANHYKIADKLNIKTFFTHPYSSQEKGTVENRIGVIRRFLSKQRNFFTLTKSEIKNVEELLNNRPLRMFNYLSAKQYHENEITKYRKVALIT